MRCYYIGKNLVVDLGVVELIKALFDISDKFIDVPWCLGMLEWLNGVD